MFIKSTLQRLQPNFTRQLHTTSTLFGVTRKLIKEGDQKTYPKKGDLVTIHYTGKLTNGTVFDSSIGRTPFQTQIGVGNVIRGWDEGVPQMSLGEKAVLEITSDYAYGDQGYPGVIPPKATLVFEVELLGIE